MKEYALFGVDKNNRELGFHTLFIHESKEVVQNESTRQASNYMYRAIRVLIYNSDTRFNVVEKRGESHKSRMGACEAVRRKLNVSKFGEDWAIEAEGLYKVNKDSSVPYPSTIGQEELSVGEKLIYIKKNLYMEKIGFEIGMEYEISSICTRSPEYKFSIQDPTRPILGTYYTYEELQNHFYCINQPRILSHLPIINNKSPYVLEAGDCLVYLRYNPSAAVLGFQEGCTYLIEEVQYIKGWFFYKITSSENTYLFSLSDLRFSFYSPVKELVLPNDFLPELLEL